MQEQVNSTLSLRSETHRPLRRLKRDLLRAGLRLEQVSQTKSADLERFEPASDFLLLRLRPVAPHSAKVSLMIKACVMEGGAIEHLVQHLVTQLEEPVCFHERILVVDSRQEDFLRQYAKPEPSVFREACRRLLAEGWIDSVYHAPADVEAVKPLLDRWFAIETTDTHAANGAQLSAVVAGFERCSGDYVLHVDSDVMVCRSDREHNYLCEMINVLELDPRGLTVALNIAQPGNRPYTFAGPDGPWRVEARAGLIHRERLLAGRPYANSVVAGTPQLTWYRSIDQSARQGIWRSYRGGDCRTYYIHPLNKLKEKDPDSWMLLLDCVEQGKVPAIQHGQPDLQVALAHWFKAERFEPYVFIIGGRNVPSGRFWRCLDSLLAQNRRDWGAIIIDDGSNELSREFVALLSRPHSDRITLVRPRARRGLLANMVLGIRHLCGNPESVILTLDADDLLLGSDVIDRHEADY